MVFRGVSRSKMSSLGTSNTAVQQSASEVLGALQEICISN